MIQLTQDSEVTYFINKFFMESWRVDFFDSSKSPFRSLRTVVTCVWRNRTEVPCVGSEVIWSPSLAGDVFLAEQMLQNQRNIKIAVGVPENI